MKPPTRDQRSMALPHTLTCEERAQMQGPRSLQAAQHSGWPRARAGADREVRNHWECSASEGCAHAPSQTHARELGGLW